MKVLCKIAAQGPTLSLIGGIEYDLDIDMNSSLITKGIVIPIENAMLEPERELRIINPPKKRKK